MDEEKVKKLFEELHSKFAALEAEVLSEDEDDYEEDEPEEDEEEEDSDEEDELG